MFGGQSAQLLDELELTDEALGGHAQLKFTSERKKLLGLLLHLVERMAGHEQVREHNSPRVCSERGVTHRTEATDRLRQQAAGRQVRV